MFDTLKCIWAGMAGDLKDLGEGRKSVWLLIFTWLAGLAATAFAAWVSYQAYQRLIGWIPYSDVIAWAFTTTIALFMYFSLANIAGFAVERMRGVEEQDRDYSVVGFRIYLIATILFGFLDFNMNLQGGREIVHEHAGQVSAPDFNAISQQNNELLMQDRQKLDDLLAGKMGMKGWRDPKTGIYYLNKSGKRMEAALLESIATKERAIERGQSAAEAEWKQQESERTRNLQNSESIVTVTVYFIYVIMLILCLVQAFIVETIQAEAGTTGKKGFRQKQSTYTPTLNNQPRMAPVIGYQRSHPDSRHDQPPITNTHYNPRLHDTERPDTLDNNTLHAARNAAHTSVEPLPQRKPDTRNTGGGGFPATCYTCGKHYTAGRKPREGERSFCCEEHKNEYHNELKKLEAEAEARQAK